MENTRSGFPPGVATSKHPTRVFREMENTRSGFPSGEPLEFQLRLVSTCFHHKTTTNPSTHLISVYAVKKLVFNILNHQKHSLITHKTRLKYEFVTALQIQLGVLIWGKCEMMKRMRICDLGHFN